MVSETFVVLTKMALEIQPQFTYGFIGLRSCILGLKKKKKIVCIKLKICSPSSPRAPHYVFYTICAKNFSRSASSCLWQVKCRIPSMTADTLLLEGFVL